MAPTIGRLALDNGFHGSIPGDLVALPPQNIQAKLKGYRKLVKKRTLCIDINVITYVPALRTNIYVDEEYLF